MKCDFSILSLCQTLDVSTSGYYDWRQRRDCPGPRAWENQILPKRSASFTPKAGARTAARA